MAGAAQIHRFRAGRVRVIYEYQPTAISFAAGYFVGCGSRHEPRAYRGLTHLAEHLFFKGTSQLSAIDISRVIESVGGELNAYTDREYTCYHAWVPPQHSNLALNLLGEMLFDSTFDEEEFEREKNVVIQELLASEESADDEFGDAMLEALWGKTGLGARVGAHSSQVRTLTHKKLSEYLTSHVLRAPLVIAAAGPLKPAQFRAQVQQAIAKAEQGRWGKYLGGTNRPLPQQTPNPRTWVGASKLQNFKSAQQAQVGFHFPSVSIKDSDEVLVSALSAIWGGLSSSRLYKELREKRGLAYFVYAQLHNFSDTGVLSGYFSTERKNVKVALKVCGSVCRELAAGVSKEDVEFVRSWLAGAIQMGFEGVASRMDTLGRHELLLGRTFTLEQAMAEIQRVTRGNLNRVARVLGEEPCFYGLGPLRQSELPAMRRAWKEG